MPSAKPARRALGVDPLDALTGGDELASKPPEATRSHPKPPAYRESSKAVKVNEDVLARLRGAVLFLAHNGHPYATLKGVIEEAAIEWVERFEDEHNGGRPFSADSLPRGGRMQPR